MRKGLGVTLLTVAIAMMGLKAMSSAPMIEAVPNPVVGDRSGSSSANVFVFPDAITLLATDDNTSASGIVWTFTVADPANPRYVLNGHDPVDLASVDANDNPNNPGSTKRIDQAVANTEENPDANAKTVTIRDKMLSPFPAQTSYADPAGGPGIVGTEVVTLIASDGTTYSTKDFVAWTDDEGEDRYSGGASPGEPVKNVDFTTSTGGFVVSTWNGGAFSGLFLATMTSGVNGMCMQTPAGTATDAYLGSWASPYGWFDLAQNSVYKIRMQVSGNSTQVLTTPLWTFFVENFGSEAEGYPGSNAYSGQVYELDNEGGANAAASYGRNVFYFYFTPAPVQTAQWNDVTNGAFTSQYDAGNDPRVHFRVLDANANIVCQNRLGTLCMTSMTIDRFDISAVKRGTVAYDQTTFSASDGYVHNYASTVTYPSGKCLISPPGTAQGWGVEVATLSPGEILGYSLDPAHVATTWPVPWPATTDTLWMYEATIVAPTANDEANPPDIVALRIDTPTYEVFGENNAQALTFLGQQGMPKQAASVYTMFFNTQTLTASTIANYDAFRPMVEVTCHTNLTQQKSTLPYRSTNTGAIRVDEMKITEVSF